MRLGNARWSTWVPPAANLCQGNAVASAVDGPAPFNTINGTNITLANTVWNWTCTDNTTSAVSSCTEQLPADCANGTGNVVNGVLSTTAPNPASQLLCDVGSPSAITYEDNPWGFMTKKAWVWTCDMDGSSWDTCAIFDQNSGNVTDGDPHPGLCGSASYGSFLNAPTVGLCSQGTPTAPWTDGWNWYWTCTGSTGENTVV